MAMTRREVLVTAGCLGAASLVWGGLAGPALGAGVDGPAWRDALAEARIWPWEGGPRDELMRVHKANPEYDFMSRTFLVLALGDLALDDPDRWRSRAMRAIDAILDDTLATVARRGPGAFSMSYWGAGQTRTGRSLFIDGELLLMLGVRRLLADSPTRREQAALLARQVVECMVSTPIGSGESYPNECWSFCNTLALAALRMHDQLSGTDHGPLARRWVGIARDRLIHSDTGLLNASYTAEGSPKDGPEGSTLWLCAHMLRLVDPDVASQQYTLCRMHLGRIAGGFGWAREWPVGHEGRPDVDSGPIVPGMDASASSSGLAILAARSFGDSPYARALLASLTLAASPVTEQGRLRFAASNAVGDSVILAGLTVGSVWRAFGAREEA